MHVDEVRANLAKVSAKAYRGGTDRAASPEDTLARVAPVVRAAGITRVGAIGGLDRIGLPVYCAYRPASRNLAVSQGKGLTAAAAQASAVMEAVELWHAERHHLPVRYDTYSGLRAAGADVVDVAGIVTCPCNEYAPDRPLRWTRGLELVSDRVVWVPYEAVHCDWRVPTAEGEHAFQNGSNGLASGNTLAEAVVHALCEVVERDAIVRFDRLPEEVSVARRVDPDTVGDDRCQQALHRFGQAGIEVVIWDMTSPVGLPTYSCVAVENDAPWYQPLPQTQGAGAHPTRGLALLRAVTETAQARAAIIAGSRDDIFDERYAHYFDDDARHQLAGELDIPATRRFADTGEVDHDTANDDLAWLVERLTATGHREVVVVDLTDPAWGVPVVKVLVPGLEWRPWEE